MTTIFQILLTIFAVSATVLGCTWNSFELEVVVSHPSGLGKGFGYGLTILQCIGVAFFASLQYVIIKLYYAYRHYFICSGSSSGEKRQTTRSMSRSVSQNHHQEDDNNTNMNTIQKHEFKRLLPIKYVFAGSILFWLSNVSTNMVFKFGIAVPIMQIIRSSGLLSTALVSYFWVGKRFSLLQIFLLFCITAGITTLSLSSSSNSNSNKTNSSTPSCQDCTSSSTPTSKQVLPLFPDPNDSTAVLNWFIGAAVCIAASFFTTFLGMSQSAMFEAANKQLQEKQKLNDIPGVTEEAIASLHASCLVIFALVGSEGVIGPVNHFLFEMPFDLQMALVRNILSQYFCIVGVFTMSKLFSAFYTTMATTVRKFMSLVMSLLVFGHGQHLNLEQFLSICVVTVAVAVYPFVPSPAAVTTTTVTPPPLVSKEVVTITKKKRSSKSKKD